MDSQVMINTAEILEVKPLSELVSEAIIKVCWVSEGANPNDTVITKEVGREIAATLPGAPVAGFFNKETGDFEEHSRRISFQQGELIVEDITKPYGFVSPTDNPWYQDFMEDGVVRTYLMCKAYFWTRQYEEASLAMNKGQSMELYEPDISGYYSGGVFIFTSATTEKLCILGDDFAPCFSGAKIMSTYSKQYTSLAEELERIIGRRYYVMNDQLVVKPAIYDYAVQLGWNLEDAIYTQLRERGADGKYGIKGIFIEGNQIFTILQDTSSTECVRCDISITGQETVELGTEMVAVTQTWTEKGPAEPGTIEALNGAEAVPNQDIPLNVAATYSAEGNGEEPPVEGAPATEFTNDEPAATEPAATEPPAAEPPADFTAEEGAAEPPAEPAAEPPADFTADPTGEAEPPAPEATPEPPQIDYAQKCEELTTQVTDYAAQVAAFEAQIAEKDATISDLNATIATYRQAEADAINAQKQEIIQSYAALLTEDEMGDLNTPEADLSEYTVDSLEAKLAVTYARKQKAALNPQANYQVNINSLDGDPEADLPDFMKQALEFDRSRNGGITQIV